MWESGNLHKVLPFEFIMYCCFQVTGGEDKPYNQQNVDILPVKKDGMISLRFPDEEICKMKDCEKITALFFSGWWAVSSGWKRIFCTQGRSVSGSIKAIDPTALGS